MTKREQIIEMLLARNPQIAHRQMADMFEAFLALQEAQTQVPVMIKGEKGDTPAIADIVEALKPHIPAPIKGEDGVSPSIDEIVQAVLPHIKHGRDGQTPIHGIDYLHQEDMNRIVGRVTSVIPKPQEVVIPDIKGMVDEHIEAYKKNLPTNDSIVAQLLRHPLLRVLMHGGGGTSTGAALSILVATGTVDNNNLQFTFVSKPSIVTVNGASYQENHGWSWAGLTATLDQPVGTGGNIYALG